MAEFCKECIKKYIGLNPRSKYYKSWLVEDGFICEGCGYAYMGIEHPLNHTKLIIKKGNKNDDKE